MESPERRLMVRSENRLVAGVCGGLSEHLGIALPSVRLAFIALSALGGIGILLYAWLWVFVPSAEEAQADELRSRGTRSRSLAEEMSRVQQGLFGPGQGAEKNSVWRDTLIGAGLVALALLGFGQWIGWEVRWDMIWPVLAIVAGILLAWLQFDERSTAQRGRRPVPQLLRLAAGLILVVGGLLVLLGNTAGTSNLLGGLWSGLAMLVGAVVVLLPWGTKLWRDFIAERSSRQAAAQRAEFAAHLHDSVLQTLAVIQKRSDDPAAVRTLARVQERELRQWLYGNPDLDEEDVSVAIQHEASDIEQLLLRDVEVISVGTAQGFTGQQALVAASREAMMNAAKHAPGKISVFIECTAEQVEVFVRDRGPGFDLDAIDQDRHGVRESIIGRMQRAGGSAKIRSSEAGTEVQLCLPRETTEEE